MSAIPLTDMRNTLVYRELLNRANKGIAEWDKQYGRDASTTKPTQDQMINLGSFMKYEKKVAALGTVEDQLRTLRDEHKLMTHEVTDFSTKWMPKHSRYPVSQASIDVWGDAAWHTQARQECGSPSSHKRNPEIEAIEATLVRPKWGINHQGTHYYLPAHITARSAEFTQKFAAAA